MRTLTPPNPPLQDDVVLLRPPQPEDADALLPIRSEEDTRRWMLWVAYRPAPLWWKLVAS